MAQPLDGSLSCRICKVPVCVFDHGDGTYEYLHAREWDEFDHEPDPVPASQVGAALLCDFCGVSEPRWSHRTPGRVELRGADTEHSRDFGTAWAACDECDRLIRRKNTAALIDRHLTSRARAELLVKMAERYPDDPTTAAQTHVMERELVTRMLTGVVAVLGGRQPIRAFEPAARIQPRHLHKIRRRLIETWDCELIRRVLVSTPDPVNVPGLDCDVEDFAVTVGRLSPQVRDRFVERTRQGLRSAQLWWVSEDFTRLAIGAGHRLPDLNVLDTDLPSPNGLVVFATPIMELDQGDGMDRPLVVAASWVTIPDRGVWVSLYCQPEQIWPDQGREDLREQLGALFPIATGAGVPFGLSVDLSGLPMTAQRTFGTLVAFWALVDQQGVAGVRDEPADKGFARSYARAHGGTRPDPVKIVDIRRLGRKTQGSSGSAHGYVLTKRSLVGGATGGFWRNQAYGPRRSLRKRLWINPFVRGPDDAPFANDVPTVRVIR